MILETALLLAMWPFKHHQKPVTGKTAAQVAFSKIVDEDIKYVVEANKGVVAYEADVLYAQYERNQLDEFEAQLKLCMSETNDIKFDEEVQVLLEKGKALDAYDEQLHKENVI